MKSLHQFRGGCGGECTYAVQHPDLTATRPDTVSIMIRLDRPPEKTNQSGVDTTWTPNISGTVGRTNCR